MSEVIDLNKYRKKKDASNVTGIKQEMRKSLDNNEVKCRYGIKAPPPPPPPPPTFEERAQRIRESVQRINLLMQELKEKNDDKNKV